MANTLPQHIQVILQKIFNDSIENLTIDEQEGNKKGDGYLGDLVFLTVAYKKDNVPHNLVIKQCVAGVYPEEFVTATYLNEINFYTKRWPAMTEFQKKHLGEEDPNFVKHIAKCYYTDITKGAEKIVLDNLKFKGFELHPKSIPLNFRQYASIFKLYAKYHAISFAMKQLEPEKFEEFTKDVPNNWERFFITNPGPVGMTTAKIKMTFNPTTDQKLAEAFGPYHDNGNDILIADMQYDGPYKVFLHADCWSNNIMFKYNDYLEIDDLRIIDFQMCFVGTPVYDLTYSLFSGAGKEALDRTDELLDIYYQSLSEALKKYGLDPEKTYPQTAFKEEWKKWNKFGFFISILVLSAKENAKARMKDLVQYMYDKQLL
ncbi:uncharacterized protein LOC114331579 [Diabrotica virgifera virgifera]|uniref:Uncharacterized protein LOC114331579 n=1 Tax=Diabrotica virgifera virgifera TaxID=50390 RepID=A0A6P7FWI4_DIAVI|nr:uncharacterized protein LOC114331579 [Diabrotica virgifera virgifera]